MADWHPLEIERVEVHTESFSVRLSEAQLREAVLAYVLPVLPAKARNGAARSVSVMFSEDALAGGGLELSARLELKLNHLDEAVCIDPQEVLCG